MARQIGTRPTVAGGLTLTTAGLGYFATATAASGYPHYLIATMVMSAGIGLAMAPATASIISALPGPMIGAGSATNNATRNLGSVLRVLEPHRRHCRAQGGWGRFHPNVHLRVTLRGVTCSYRSSKNQP